MRAQLCGTCVVLALLAPAPLARSAPDSSLDTDSAGILKQHGVEPNTDAVLKLLHQWQPDAVRRAEITAAIRQLGDDNFHTRDSASRRLTGWGAVAIAPLRDAARSDDPEAATRAAAIVRQWDCGGHEQDLLAAGAQWLAASPAPQATPFLLELLPDLPDPFAQEAIGSALWACARPEDAPAIRKSLSGASNGVRAVLLPALEVAEGEAAVQALQPALSDADERVRLAAARALIDRRPHQALEALVGLLRSDDADVRGQSAWLLKQSSGIPDANDPAADFAALTRKWTAWAAGVEAHRPLPLGRRRLQPVRFGELLSESFAEAADQQSIMKQAGYRKFQYETTIGGGVSVKDGMLRLEGSRFEGDQRLLVDSNRLLGLPQFPRHLIVKAAVGGEATGAGVWHVGIAAGNVRFLFHPAFPGGAFRAERVQDHFFLLENQTMPFTPEGGVLYDMTLKAVRDDNGDVAFDVTISSPANPAQCFTRSLLVKKADIGDMTRIALERSGRTGGAALFGPVTIREGSTP